MQGKPDSAAWRRRHRSAAIALAAWAAPVLLAAAAAAADSPVRVHALVGVRIVAGPGQLVPAGTVVLRDGIIAAAGAGVAAPPDARVWDGAGLTVYPGLIEPYAVRSVPEPKSSEQLAASHPNSLVRPDRAITAYAFDEGAAKKLRAAGFATAVLAPKEGLFRGKSALVNLGDGDYQRNLLRGDLAHNVTLRPGSGDDAPYPESLMGAVALFRQTLVDAGWQRAAQAAYTENPAQTRPEWTPALATLAAALANRELVVFETDDPLDTLRNAALAREFALRAWIVGNGQEYRRLAAVKATGLPHLLPINFPKAPQPSAPAGDPNVELDLLRHWDAAPDNPRLLLEAGVETAFSSHGLEDPAKLHEHLARAIARGLTADQALAGLTTTPARLLGIADRAGTIEAGKMANLVVVEGDLFVDRPKIRAVWVDGDRYEIKDSKPPEGEPAGTWALTAKTGDGQEFPITLVLAGKASALTGTVAAMGQTIALAAAEMSGKKLEVTFPGDALGMPGTISFTIDIDGDQASGAGSTPDTSFSISGTRTSKPEAPR